MEVQAGGDYFVCVRVLFGSVHARDRRRSDSCSAQCTPVRAQQWQSGTLYLPHKFRRIYPDPVTVTTLRDFVKLEALLNRIGAYACHMINYQNSTVQGSSLKDFYC